MKIYNAYQNSEEPLEKAFIVSAGLEQNHKYRSINSLSIQKTISTYGMVAKERLKVAVDEDFDKLQEATKNLIKDSENLDDSILVEKLSACCTDGRELRKIDFGFCSYNDHFDLKTTEEEIWN